MDNKETIRARGADVGSIGKGKRARILLEDGRWISTSPIIEYFVGNSSVIIETKNHTYII